MLCCNAMDGRNALAASQRPLLELPTRFHAWITRIYQMKNEQQKTAPKGGFCKSTLLPGTDDVSLWLLIFWFRFAWIVILPASYFIQFLFLQSFVYLFVDFLLSHFKHAPLIEFVFLYLIRRSLGTITKFFYEIFHDAFRSPMYNHNILFIYKEAICDE